MYGSYEEERGDTILYMPPRETAGGIIVRPGGKIILIEQYGNSWAFPKGGVEGNETLLQAALREVQEETGLTELRHIRDLGSYERYSIAIGGVGEDRTQPMSRRTMFLFRSDQLIPPDHNDPAGEITQVREVGVAEALSLLTHPKDRAFLESIRDTIEG